MSSVLSKQPLNGVERTTDSYFKTPALKIGYGKRTCTLTRNKVQHLYQAMVDNGVQGLFQAFEDFLADTEGETKSTIPTATKGTPLKTKVKTAVLAPPPEEDEQVIDLGDDDEPDDLPQLG